MDTTIVPQYILRLPGISLSGYKPVEDLFDDRLMSKLEEMPQVVTYDKVPNSFNGLKSWPKQTNLKCIVCDRLFREIPKFYAKDLAKDVAGNIEMSPIVGFMCSFACVRLYIDSIALKKEERWQALERLYLMYRIFTGIPGEDTKNILPAPSKTEREEYGGTWDMEKFNLELRKVDVWIDKNGIILDRMRNSDTLDTIVTNAVLTGKMNSTSLNNFAVQSSENESQWENAIQTKFDGVAYD